MALAKAFVEILAGARKGERLPVLFNPAEYSLERSNAYKSTALPGLGSPLVQFVNGDAQTLSMDLFLDDYTDPDGPAEDMVGAAAAGGSKSVRERIDAFTALLDIAPELHAPPPVRFVWGPLRFEAVIEKIGRKANLFRPDGTPARATLSVAFREYRPLSRDAPRIRLESTDRTKRRQIRAGESIWLIADREYGNPRHWRVIAEASDVDEPRALTPGDWLLLPPLEAEDAPNRPF